MKRFRRPADHAVGIVDLNLLPVILRPSEVSPVAVAVAAGLLVAALAVAPLAFKEHSAQSKASTITTQANEAEQSVHGIELTTTRKRSLQAQLDETNSKTAALRVVRERLQGGKRALGADLTKALDRAALPPGARIVSVSGTDRGFKVDGLTAAPLDAIAYAEHLVSNEGFTSARMVSFTPAAVGGQFTVEVTR